MREALAYRVYFFSASDHIRYVCGLKAADDLEARSCAEATLSGTDYSFFELYEGWRLVWRSGRRLQAA